MPLIPYAGYERPVRQHHFDKAEALKLKDEGHSFRAIADILDVSPDAIRRGLSGQYQPATLPRGRAK